MESFTCLSLALVVALDFAPDALVVLPNAKDVARENRYNGVITYTVADEYPADKTIKALSERLVEAGWAPTDALFNAPGATAQRKWRIVRARGRNDGSVPFSVEKALRVQITKFSTELAQQIKVTR